LYSQGQQNRIHTAHHCSDWR